MKIYLSLLALIVVCIVIASAAMKTGPSPQAFTPEWRKQHTQAIEDRTAKEHPEWPRSRIHDHAVLAQTAEEMMTPGYRSPGTDQLSVDFNRAREAEEQAQVSR